MHASKRHPPPAELIACSIFEKGLDYLQRRGCLDGYAVTYLPARLHLRPAELRARLEETVTTLKAKKRPIVLLYGICFADIDEFCQRHGLYRVRGDHCYEMMLGRKRYHRILSETAGTFFLEYRLVENFREYCIEPLELDDLEMRRLFFRHYRRLLYLRQPGEQEMGAEVAAIGDYLELPVAGTRVDYAALACRLGEIQDMLSSGNRPKDLSEKRRT